MNTFVDREKRTWNMTITVGDVARVRKRLGVDLAALANDKFQALGDLLSDPCRFVDVLYVILEPQAKDLGLSEDDFGCGFAGDSIMHAANSFVAEFADFQRNPKLRRQIHEMWAAAQRVEDRLLAESARLIASIDPEAQAAKIIADIAARQGVKAASLKLAECAE
jgi:hypothetical protein